MVSPWLIFPCSWVCLYLCLSYVPCFLCPMSHVPSSVHSQISFFFFPHNNLFSNWRDLPWFLFQTSNHTHCPSLILPQHYSILFKRATQCWECRLTSDVHSDIDLFSVLLFYSFLIHSNINFLSLSVDVFRRLPAIEPQISFHPVSPRTRSWKSIANSKPVIIGLFSSCCIILCLSKPNFQLSFSHLVSVCRFFSHVLQSALFTVQNQLIHQCCHLTFTVLSGHLHVSWATGDLQPLVCYFPIF